MEAVSKHATRGAQHRNPSDNPLDAGCRIRNLKSDVNVKINRQPYQIDSAKDYGR